MRLAAEGGNLERVDGFQVKFYLEVKGGPAAGRVSGSGSHYKYTNIIVFTSTRRNKNSRQVGPPQDGCLDVAHILLGRLEDPDRLRAFFFFFITLKPKVE